MTAPAPLTSARAAGLSRADLYRIGICPAVLSVAH